MDNVLAKYEYLVREKYSDGASKGNEKKKIMKLLVLSLTLTCILIYL